MAERTKKSLNRSALAAYMCICLALLLLLGLGVWGAYTDMRYVRSRRLQSEVSRLKSHAQRTVGRIEQELEQHDDPSEMSRYVSPEWLGRHWKNLMRHDNQRLYAAIVDNHNVVLHHSEPANLGKRLERRWYDWTVSEAGDDVAWTHSEVLTSGEPAYDIRVPIIVNGDEVGEYHVGFDIAWFRNWVRAEQAIFLRQRALIIGVVVLIVLLGTTSLFCIATNAVGLQKEISQSQVRRATEMAQLAAGLAHEIRNPMHAIRLNLYALGRVDSENRLKLSSEEHEKLMEESTREIDRVETLMQKLVGFASPDKPRNEWIDLKAEVQSTLAFVHQEMLRQRITIQTNFPSQSVWICMDAARLRQLLLNLMRNAEQALAGPGRIDLTINLTAKRVSLGVADNGLGVPERDRQQVFEPFFSTKKDGSGLGLALAKRFVDEAGGTITCQANGGRGTTFVIDLPRSTSPGRRTRES